MSSSPPPGPEADTTAAGLSVRGLVKRFGRFPALNGVSLDVGPREFVALLGPSGSGKTTLLRSIAGLERPDEGEVLLAGRNFLALTPRQRRVGMVFQHYALFRHMTVKANIAFGLNVRPARERPPPATVRERVERLLALVQLDGLGERYPSQLSGGQRQRVALARALAIEPHLLLLDEPFGALDAKVRKELRRWLRRVHEETGVTTLFVTHDQEEAMDLADRVAVMREGRLEQVGSPRDLQDHPASAYVYEFLGDFNRLEVQVEGGRALVGETLIPVTPGPAPEGAATAYFRPHEAVLTPSGEGLTVQVLSNLRRGGYHRIECRDADGRLFEVDQQGADGFAPGDSARLTPRRLTVFKGE